MGKAYNHRWYLIPHSVPVGLIILATDDDDDNDDDDGVNDDNKI
jgi:hypothetical protein